MKRGCTKNRHHGRYNGNGKQEKIMKRIKEDCRRVNCLVNDLKYRTKIPTRLKDIDVANEDPKQMLMNIRTWLKWLLRAYTKGAFAFTTKWAETESMAAYKKIRYIRWE